MRKFLFIILLSLGLPTFLRAECGCGLHDSEVVTEEAIQEKASSSWIPEISTEDFTTFAILTGGLLYFRNDITRTASPWVKWAMSRSLTEYIAAGGTLSSVILFFMACDCPGTTGTQVCYRKVTNFLYGLAIVSMATMVYIRT